MAVNSNIAWTTHTWNPWTGCTPVSEGCAHCYMERWAKRCGRDPAIVKRSSDQTFKLPLSTKVKAGDVVFVCSLSDFFHPDVDVCTRDDATAIMLERPDVIFLLLTKRAEGIARWADRHAVLHCQLADARARLRLKWNSAWDAPSFRERSSHIWLGVTAENQARAEERIPSLLAVAWPGKRFVSVEPMIGPIDLMYPESLYPKGPTYCCAGQDCCCRGMPIEAPMMTDVNTWQRIDWVIVGGESGSGCRPMELAWARSVRDQCRDARVAFFMKQLGGWPNKRDDVADLPMDLQIRETPTREENGDVASA